mmetsp:Transcript_4469/g.13506  ORF Transcript_4469/g.13506 Transcript_4469/m.13506 type:complete len:113 (-) Transcript_4469:181-519(-)
MGGQRRVARAALEAALAEVPAAVAPADLAAVRAAVIAGGGGRDGAERGTAERQPSQTQPRHSRGTACVAESCGEICTLHTSPHLFSADETHTLTHECREHAACGSKPSHLLL